MRTIGKPIIRDIEKCPLLRGLLYSVLFSECPLSEVLLYRCVRYHGYLFLRVTSLPVGGEDHVGVSNYIRPFRLRGESLPCSFLSQSISLHDSLNRL